MNLRCRAKAGGASTCVAIMLVTGSCGTGEAESPANRDLVQEQPEPEPEPVPATLATMRFGPFEPWASPIQDYIAVGEAEYPRVFNASIHDLSSFGDQLYLAYGDGTYNLGEHVSIEIRRFISPDDPTASAMPIDGAGQGAVQVSPYQSGEEQIDRFRVIDGELWQPGVDSIDADEHHTQATTDPPGIRGNVYRLAGSTWRKHRSITGGEHVHDVAHWSGATFAVGSGADTRLEFEAGRVFRYLWRSEDLGTSFSTVQRIEVNQTGNGDTRWLKLLPGSDKLYLFGYESDFTTGQAHLKNAVFDGVTVEDLPASNPLARVLPDDVLVLPGGRAVVFGAEVTSTSVHYAAFVVAADGAATPLAPLAGATVLDAATADTGEIVYLAMAGNAYGADVPDTVELVVLVAPVDAPDAVTELVRWSAAAPPASIVYWRGALFLGTRDGTVMRSSQFVD